MIILRKILLWACFIGMALFIYPNICRAGGSQQTSGATAWTIIQQARDYLDENTATFWADSQLLNILSKGVMDVVARTHCMEGVTDIYLSTGVSEYTISPDYIALNTAIYSGSSTSYKGLIRTIPQTTGHHEDVGEPVYWYEWNGRIGIDPIPSSSVSGDSVYLYYVERPSGLTATSDAIVTPAIYDQALIFFVASRAFYLDRQFDIGARYITEYMAELDRFRSDLIEKPKEPREIVR